MGRSKTPHNPTAPEIDASGANQDEKRACQRNQAERSSPDSLLVPNSARWTGNELVWIGSLMPAAVRLHNQNMRTTVVSPRESHPIMNT
jgi:hypothetical protein